LFKVLILAAAAAFYAGAVPAADFGSGMFSFNAFGTLGMVHSSEDNADFTTTYFKPNGAGYSHDWSGDVDSDLGAQLTATFTPQLSAVLQIIVEQNYANSYRPEIEWANLKYRLTPDFSVRVGRIVLPVFLVSDFRKVGYANPWLRPPQEVYGVEPLTNNDGLDFTYRLRVGGLTSSLSSTYGRHYRIDFPLAESTQASDLWGVFDKTEYGAALLNLSYVRAHIRLEPDLALFNAFRDFGAQGNAIADDYDLENKLATIITVGASYDPGKWFASAEWTQFETHSFLGISTGWYVSGGYRIAKFTPYATYSALRVIEDSTAGLELAALPAPLVPAAIAVNAGLEQILGSRAVQRTLSAGARWDFAKDLDLKLQIDHTRLGPGSPGTLIDIQPGFRPGGTVNLFSLAVDFVF
jgi:hypothetical protein